MGHTLGPLVLLLGSTALLAQSVRFRLPIEWIRIVTHWGLAAAAWPAAIPPVRADRWDVLICLGATALCAIASAHTHRTRIAQLRPGWDHHLHQELRRGPAQR